VIIRLREERGISAIIVSISLVALFGAAMLAIDAGSAWATRRKIVTGTDAAALAAARYFANNPGQACLNGDGTWNGVDAAGGNAEASTVLSANSSSAEHDPADGFALTVSGCSSGFPVGHVRFDGRLGSQQSFSGLFGFSKVKPFSSSTAQFGYLIAPVGLRPIAVCDQASTAFATQPVASPPGSPDAVTGTYPHYALFNWLVKGQHVGGPIPYNTTFTQSDYDKYFGSLTNEYPSVSLANGDSVNDGQAYMTPAAGGGVVHRISATDNCGGGANYRGWVDLNGGANGTGSDNKCPPDEGKLQSLECMLLTGYDGNPGPVSLGDSSATPPLAKECNNSENEFCQIDSGNHNGIKDALNPITCAYNVKSADCPYVFPIILTDTVTGSPKPVVHQQAFVYVVLRGWGALDGDAKPCQGQTHSCWFDFEFVRVQGTGAIGRNPSPNYASPPATSLCGIDHDSVSHRCSV
jgi:hypothetical protein